MFVEYPRLSLTAIALDVKLLCPMHDVDTIFSNHKSFLVVG